MTLSGSPSSHALKLHTLIASPLIRHRGHSAGRFVLLSGELWKPRAHPACPSVARVPVSPTRARHVSLPLADKEEDRAVCPLSGTGGKTHNSNQRKCSSWAYLPFTGNFFWPEVWMRIGRRLKLI